MSNLQDLPTEDYGPKPITLKPRKFDDVERAHKAAPITNHWVDRTTYSIGDGEVKLTRRPGSDHSHLKSKGVRC